MIKMIQQQQQEDTADTAGKMMVDVGLSGLLGQVRRKVLRQGVDFSLMVVGEAGLGKSTLINSMFSTDLMRRDVGELTERTEKTVRVEAQQVRLEEGGINLNLTLVDTPGFGDLVDNTDCWVPITNYLETQFNKFLEAESRVSRVVGPDTRVDACLYFIAPTGHGLRQVDLEFLRRLHDKVRSDWRFVSFINLFLSTYVGQHHSCHR